MEWLLEGREWCLSAACYFCTEPIVTCTEGGLLEGAVMYFVSGLSEPLKDSMESRCVAYYHYTLFFLLRSFIVVHCSCMLHRDSEYVKQRMELMILDYLSLHFDSKIYLHQMGTMVYADRGRS